MHPSPTPAVLATYITAIKRFFDTLIQTSLDDYPSITFTEWTRLVPTIVGLFNLMAAQHLDPASCAAVAEFGGVIEILYRRMRELSIAHPALPALGTEHKYPAVHASMEQPTLFYMWYRVLRLVETKYKALLQQVSQRAHGNAETQRQRQRDPRWTQLCPVMNKAILGKQYYTPESESYINTPGEELDLASLDLEWLDFDMLGSEVPSATNSGSAMSHLSSDLSRQGTSMESPTNSSGDGDLGSGRTAPMQGFLVGGLLPLGEWGGVPLFENSAGNGSENRF
jgi:hypothetical protein